MHVPGVMPVSFFNDASAAAASFQHRFRQRCIFQHVHNRSAVRRVQHPRAAAHVRRVAADFSHHS
jgi:hypothetical protein